ncbi:MAG: hypothetical protein HY979_02585, partial [Candidatus Magasanikbacteria bacterium]|nr:hypothetical protein [Candidatus Magasanikbacteria bacterium]
MLREVFNPQNYSWSMWSLPPLLSSIYFWALGIFIVSKNIKARINISFGILSLCSGLWLFSYAVGFSMITYDSSLFWSRNAYSGINFIAIAMYHFVVEFLDLKKQRKWVYAFYGLMLAFFPVTRTKYFLGGVVKYSWGYYPYRANFIYDLFILSFCFYWFLALFNLYRAYRKEASDLKKSQIKIISVALYVVTIAFVDFVAKYKLPVYPWGYVPVTIFLSLIFYTIIRYRLMEIDTVIHRTILWLITLLILVLPVSGLGLIFKNWLIALPPIGILLLSSLVLMFFVGYFNTLKPRIDHVFRRRKYDYYEVLNGLGQKVGSELEIDKVQARIFKELKEILYISNGILLAQKPGQEDYKEVAGLSKQANAVLISLLFHSKLSQYLNREQKAIEREQVEVDPQYQEIKEET